MLSIRSNIAPTFNLHQTENQVERSLSRLSSGLRIQRSSDDAAGVQIAGRMETQVRGDQQAARNIQDALSFLQLAQDGIHDVVGVLQRMRELTVEGGNSTIGATSITAINSELQQLGLAFADAKNIAYEARINFQAPVGQRIVIYQVGADSGQTATFDFNQLSSVMNTFITALPTLTVNTTTAADASRTTIDAAIDGVNTELTKLGGFVNALGKLLDNVSREGVEQAAGLSRVQDADVADETVQLVRSQLAFSTGLRALDIHNLRLGSIAKVIYGATAA